jgi:carboxypeptidase Taq
MATKKTNPVTNGAGAKGLAKRSSPRAAERQMADLKARLLEIGDLGHAASVMGWDMATYMPAGGAKARGRAQATLGRLMHERFTDKAIGRLLDKLQPYADSLPSDHDDACQVRVLRRSYERALKVPSEFVARSAEHSAKAYETWKKARPANDFAAVRDDLEKTLDLSREWLEYFAPYQHIMDPAIDGGDEGMTTASVTALFEELRARLVPIVEAITAEPPEDDSCLRLSYPEPQQLAFGLEVANAFGYDLERGRLDKTPHPFCSSFALGDVRITTRVQEHDLGDALFSTLHETGHALYEMGVAPELEHTSLGGGCSFGVHESQSRLWENIVARSRGFWQHWYPRLQTTFPDQLGSVPLDTFYRAINKVQRSLIRTDADELTYNLHVMLRFDLERDLLEGKLAVKDLPQAWAARFQTDLGIAPPDDKDGVLQDVHWFSGGIGGSFQGYAIGNILSAQVYAAALKAHPSIPAEIARGQFGTLHGWLEANLYRHGRKFPPAELIERATGQPMHIEPYIAYLKGKYGELYRLQ